MADALDDLEADIEDLLAFIDTYRDGVGAPILVSSLIQVAAQQSKDPSMFEKLQQMSKRLKPSIERGERVRLSGFQYLYGIAIVRLWSALEATMNDVCRARLEQNDYWRSGPVLKGIRVDLSVFVATSPEDQPGLVFSKIEEKGEGRRAPGVGRFESLLKDLELGGEVAASVRKRLLWLAEARHVLVHRQGKVDQKFLDAYPDPELKLGEKLVIREHEFARSLAAVRAYLAIVGIRLQEARLVNARSEREAALRELVAQMEEHDARQAG